MGNGEEEQEKVRRDSRTFTLWKAVFVAILVAGVARLAAVIVRNRLEEAKIHEAKTQLSRIDNALDSFKGDNGFYPDSLQGLMALVVPPNVWPPLRHYNLRDNKLPLDPWGHPPRYACEDGYHFQVWSDGPGGKAGADQRIYA